MALYSELILKTETLHGAISAISGNTLIDSETQCCCVYLM